MCNNLAVPEAKTPFVGGRQSGQAIEYSPLSPLVYTEQHDLMVGDLTISWEPHENSPSNLGILLFTRKVRRLHFIIHPFCTETTFYHSPVKYGDYILDR